MNWHTGAESANQLRRLSAVGNSCVRTQHGRDKTLTATFRQPFDLLAITNMTWQRKKAAGADSSDLRPIWLRR